MSALAGALLIFFMRVIDMSLDTVRLIMTVRGRKLLAGGIGVAQALVFILAVSAVLKGPLTVGNVLGYSLGFGAGVMLGIFFEERLAIGHSMFRIYSPVRPRDRRGAARGPATPPPSSPPSAATARWSLSTAPSAGETLRRCVQ